MSLAPERPARILECYFWNAISGMLFLECYSWNAILSSGTGWQQHRDTCSSSGRGAAGRGMRAGVELNPNPYFDELNPNPYCAPAADEVNPNPYR